mmetsp:Transcript_15264/g.38470  ORF Transcript_15264/g.38470 Transcript_15264/m.38470 type:complete len:239 (-) Transcript_15264:1090-1806(-)
MPLELELESVLAQPWEVPSTRHRRLDSGFRGSVGGRPGIVVRRQNPCRGGNSAGSGSDRRDAVVEIVLVVTLLESRLHPSCFASVASFPKSRVAELQLQLHLPAGLKSPYRARLPACHQLLRACFRPWPVASGAFPGVPAGSSFAGPCCWPFPGCPGTFVETWDSVPRASCESHQGWNRPFAASFVASWDCPRSPSSGQDPCWEAFRACPFPAYRACLLHPYLRPWLPRDWQPQERSR